LDVKQCWTWNEDLEAFLVSVRIQNPATHVSIIKWCIFDTGFTGYLGLDSETIHNLDLLLIGEGMAKTIIGDIHFRNYAGLVDIVNPAQESLCTLYALENGFEDNAQEIPIQEMRLPLLGGKSIIQFPWIIEPSTKLICLLENE
jgi:hypothetical protein